MTHADRKRVYHVNQKVTEAFEWSQLHGWVKIPLSIADDWKPGTYAFYEIRYNGTPQENTKNGVIIK